MMLSSLTTGVFPYQHYFTNAKYTNDGWFEFVRYRHLYCSTIFVFIVVEELFPCRVNLCYHQDLCSLCENTFKLP